MGKNGGKINNIVEHFFPAVLISIYNSRGVLLISAAEIITAGMLDM